MISLRCSLARSLARDNLPSVAQKEEMCPTNVTKNVSDVRPKPIVSGVDDYIFPLHLVLPGGGLR